MIELLLGDFLPYILTGVGAVAAVVLAYLKGGRDRDRKRKLEERERYIDTEERIDEALDADADAGWADRLRNSK